jgi:hypothetical protein
MCSAKEIYMEQLERGWFSLGNKYVCSNCFLDDELSDYVKINAKSNRCDYCGAQSTDLIAAPMDVIMELVARSIYFEWTDPAEELPYESREGGYQGDVYDTYELLWDIEFPTENEKLLNDVVESIALEAWCRRSPFFPPEERALFYSWEDFCREVKYRTRYLFFPKLDEYEHEQFPYTEILDRIAEIIFELNVMKPHPPGTGFYRGRVHDLEIYLSNSKELGPPPIEYAKYSNRMSPAGISMFYGSLDIETVIAEIYDRQKRGCKVITLALFESIRELNLIDLTKLPKVPSLFSDRYRHLRGGVGFLREFVRDLSKPIQKDGFERIEYVPSQIVTEFFRHKFVDEYGHHPDGILYPSSRRDQGISAVIFASSEQCLDESILPRNIEDPMLVLRRASIEREKMYNPFAISCWFRWHINRVSMVIKALFTKSSAS